LLALGDIHYLGDRPRAGGSHLRGRRIESIALHIGEHEVHAQFAADAREFAAEAAARAGDHRDLACKIFRPCFVQSEDEERL
jgi:hypothetical protein